VSVQLSPTSFDLKGGDRRTLTVKLTNAGPLARIDLTVSAPTGLAGDVTVTSSDSSCSGSGSAVRCTVDIVGNGQKSIVFTLSVKNPDSLAAGQSRTDSTGTVSATTPGGSTTLAYPVTLHGPAATPTPAGSSRVASSPTSTAASTPAASRATATAASGPAPSGTASASTEVSTDPSAPDAAVPSGGTGALFWLLVGSGAVLVLAGVAIIAGLVVRHRRNRSRPPWPAPAGGAVDGPAAPVDPWAPYPDSH
jgi:hypothetical protein